MSCYCTFYISSGEYVCIRFDEWSTRRWKDYLGRQPWGDWRCIKGNGEDTIIHYYDIQGATEFFAGEIVGQHLSDLGFTWVVLKKDDDKILVELLEMKS